MIQLRLKTEYSFGTTYAPIPHLIKKLKEQGCTSAGIVDNNTWGHEPWFKACHEAGITPLLGVSCVVSDGATLPEMWFLARDSEGLSELYRLMSKSYQQKQQSLHGSVNALTRHDVRSMSDRIIKFAGDVTDASFLKEIGAYLDFSPASMVLNSRKAMIDLPMVSVSDNSFVYESDVDVFELASRSGMKPTPMYVLDELENQDVAYSIAERCSTLRLPHAPMLHVDGDLETSCYAGILNRFYHTTIWTKEYDDRLSYELDLIKSKSFDSYFIIVADMVRYAKQHMLVGPSRGSAAGSLVCYLLGITEVDPIPAGLFFERFIDVSRSDLPDIDLDFPDNKRQMIWDYMSEKYGDTNTAHIGTVSRYRPKSTLIKVCKAIGVPPSETYAIKDAIVDKTLSETLRDTKAGQDFVKEHPEVKLAAMLEGHISHTGVHAAGLMVCDAEIINYCTVDDKGIAHVDKHSVESLGLLKIDVLGLRTLSILEDCGIDVDWYNLPLDDPKVMDVFNQGQLSGIFQYDGNALRQLNKRITIESIDDIDVASALARPGPLASGVTESYVARRNGASYAPLHPLVAKHMSATYGLPVYQEQTLAIVREVGGFNWEDTSAIRKAVSKSKGSEFMEPYWDKFLTGAVERGLTDSEARSVWDMIISMGSYQMNKAHTYSYAVISYWTAYLKAYHPLEFAVANLNNAKDEDSSLTLLRELKHEGIEFVPFDIDKSGVNWSVVDGVLYGGFIALKGIGQVKANKYVEARDAGTLTSKQVASINKAKNPYADIFPFHKHYQGMYEAPSSFGIANELVEIADINMDNAVPHGHERVFICELTYKKLRNTNEDVYVKRREGVVNEAPFDFVDVRLRDDHGDIGGRVDRFRFESIGRELLDGVELGERLLVRAKFFNGIPWAFISKWRRL